MIAFFNEAFLSDIEKENIPPKILKESRECCSDTLQKLFKNNLSN